jgi:hypothetical protein
MLKLLQDTSEVYTIERDALFAMQKKASAAERRVVKEQKEEVIALFTFVCIHCTLLQLIALDS